MIRIFYFPFILFLLIISLNVFAIIEFQDAVYPELGISGRATAMGNAYQCKVDDASSVFYNPAGLGTARKTHLHLSNLHLEVNKDWMRIATGGKLVDAAGDFFDGFSSDGMRKLLLKNKGKISHLRLQAMPNYTTRYFSVGYLFSQQMRSTIGTEENALYEYSFRRDHGPYAALNLSLFGGIFKIGASGILLSRNEYLTEVDPDVTFEADSESYNKGLGIIATAGSRLTLPIEFLPTFSAVIHNVGEQKFSGRAAGPPDTIKRTIDLGFSITPQIGKTIRIHLEGNYKDFTQEYSGVSITRRLVAGMELDFARAFFMRLGYGDGFGSAGLGIKTQHLEFDLTTYAVDTTSSEFRGKEDRRFSMSLSYGF